VLQVGDGFVKQAVLLPRADQTTPTIVPAAAAAHDAYSTHNPHWPSPAHQLAPTVPPTNNLDVLNPGRSDVGIGRNRRLSRTTHIVYQCSGTCGHRDGSLRFTGGEKRSPGCDDHSGTEHAPKGGTTIHDVLPVMDGPDPPWIEHPPIES
jgi:hypothetical protein